MKRLRTDFIGLKLPIPLGDLALLGCTCLVYSIAVASPVPTALGTAFLYGNLPVIIPLTALVFMAYRWPTRLSKFLGLSTVLAIFGLTLAGVWASGLSNFYMMAGLLPQTDAIAYLDIARALLYGQPIQLEFLRPYSSGLLAVLLTLTHQNLMLAIALLVAMVAIACFLASWEVRRTHGALPAACVLVGLFLYYRPFLGTLMTESLGLALGCLSFSILWRSAGQPNRRLALMGLAVMIYALLVRTGALFVLPALWVWGGFLFARRSGRFSGSFIATGIGLLLAGSFLNSAISNYLSSGHYISFGNYSYMLYGLLNGGDWGLVFQDHPEIFLSPDLSIAEKVATAYELSFQILREHPLALPRGILRAWAAFLDTGPRLLFTTDIPHPNVPQAGLEATIRWVFFPLLAIGLLGCLRFWKQPIYSLTLALVLGVFLSSGLLPIWDAGLRTYAVNVITGYVLLALGVYFLGQGIRWIRIKMSRLSYELPIPSNSDGRTIALATPASPKPSLIFPSAVWMSVLLILLSMGIPVLIKWTVPEQSLAVGACPAGLKARVVYYAPSATIHLVEDGAIASSRAPNIRISDFKAGLWYLKAVGVGPRATALETLNPSYSIIGGHGWQVITAATKILPDSSGYFTACGQNELPIHFSGAKQKFYFFGVRSLSPLLPIATLSPNTT